MTLEMLGRVEAVAQAVWLPMNNQHTRVEGVPVKSLAMFCEGRHCRIPVNFISASTKQSAESLKLCQEIQLPLCAEVNPLVENLFVLGARNTVALT